jgi:hypothetical protein
MLLTVITRKSSWLIKGTKRKSANYLLAALITIVMLSVPSFAQSTAITNGLNWLSSNQNMDGSFGNVVPARDTPEVADTLKYLDPTGIVYLNAVTWIGNDASSNNDYLARKINSLALSGRDVSPLLLSLTPFQATDGGWGLSSSHVVGNPLDTALALQVLKSANYSDSTVINNVLNYLIANQNTDGGFGFYTGDESNVYITALVSSTLQQFQQTTSIATAVNKATSYLIAHQNMDGGFATSTGSVSTVYETAYAYIALVGVTTDATVLGNAINYLTTTQSANGSWNDDPYSTALAIRALYFSENKPAPPPTASTTGTVTGKVVDASTNQPLAGVSIVSGQISATTTNTGEFTLSNIPQGSQTITFTLTGYSTSTSSVNVFAGGILSLGTSLLSPNPTTGIIKGAVTDASNGQPLSGATITVTGSFNGSAITGVDGSFIITNITPGSVTVTASKAGYYAVSGTGTVTAGGNLFFNPQLSTTPPIATTGSLTGKVVDGSTNLPIQGATISIAGGPSITADAQGIFLINDITPNTYQVSISATGYISQTYQVMIMADVTTDMQTIHLSPSSQSTSVSGKVTDFQTGLPIPNADVYIQGAAISTKTNSTGAYTINNINLLEFSIKASATGYNSLAYTITATTYGAYTIDFKLNQSQASNLRSISLTTDKQSYSANENVLITATIENTGSTAINTIIEAQINDNNGNTIALATPANPNATNEPFWVITVEPFSSVTVGIVWNSAQFKPGDYQINLKATVPAKHKDFYIPGDTLAEQGLPISIQPFVGVSNSAIKLNPTFTYVNAAATLAINMGFTNKSNISAELAITYTIKSPSGVILNSGSVPVSLSLDIVTANIALTAFTYNFNETGVYPVDTVVYNNGNILATAGNKFTVLSNIRIEPSRSVSPQTVIPEGTGKVKITIELKGVEVK